MRAGLETPVTAARRVTEIRKNKDPGHHSYECEQLLDSNRRLFSGCASITPLIAAARTADDQLCV
jgi:hypothetical protein